MSETNSINISNNADTPKVIPRNFVAPFILVTCLFSLWGFANDITNPMVAAFKTILLTSNFQSSLVQFAFYGGYCVMAIPAAIFIKRFTYKGGILVGLILYASGALLFVPAGMMMAFWAFLIAYFIMTCGLSFLETSANPYILSMGPEETSTQRLNFAQSFNPMGSIMGMIVASQIILVQLNPTTETGRMHLQKAAEGSPHQIQIQVESVRFIQQAQITLKSTDALKPNSKAFASVLSNISKAQYRLKCLDPAIAAQAVELQILLNGSDATSDEISRAEDKFKSLFGGNRILLDLSTQAIEEKTVLEGANPEQLMESQSQITSATKQLQSAIGLLNSATEVVDIQPVSSLLTDTLGLLNNANSSFSAIPAGASQSFLVKEGEKLAKIQKQDLDVIIGPYTVLGFVVLAVLIIFIIAKLPKSEGEDDNQLHLAATLKRLGTNRKYIEGVIAQAFYVGAQIMCWTFIIQYAVNELGMEKSTAQNYNIVAMVIFVSSRFICTFLLKFFSPGGLLMTLALGGLALVTGTIFIHGMTGLYCLIGTSACMSLMFPTIYGIALKGLGDDAKLGAAGLIMAIGGGSLMPPMQAAIMDLDAINLSFMTLSSTRASFVMPLICFVVIAAFGFRTSKVHGHTH